MHRLCEYNKGMHETATFAMGCFWGPDDYFSRLDGVNETVVGYAGGTKENPTYEDLGDHTESVQITFDPKKISYEQLLEHFWNEHDATYRTKTQYKSAIFTHGEGQMAEALLSKEKRQAMNPRPIITEIHPAGTFYRAEDYHQKYLRKNENAAC